MPLSMYHHPGLDRVLVVLRLPLLSSGHNRHKVLVSVMTLPGLLNNYVASLLRKMRLACKRYPNASCCMEV